jgi:hypothetical protein
VNDAIRPDERETMSDDDRRLAALLASVQAEANPAVWARVRTRLAAMDEPATARTPLDGFLEWLTRPAALAAATASLVVALGAGWTVLGSLETPVATTAGEEFVAADATNLMESLLEADTDDTAASEPLDAGDSAAPGDSGGRS